MLQKPTFSTHSKLSTVGENRNCGRQWKSWQNRQIGKQQRYAENNVHLAFNSNCQNILVTQDCWTLYWHWQQTQGPMTQCTLSNQTSSVLSRIPHNTNTEYYQLFTVGTTATNEVTRLSVNSFWMERQHIIDSSVWHTYFNLKIFYSHYT